MGDKQFIVSTLALSVTLYRVLSTVSPWEFCSGDTGTVPLRAAFSHCLLHTQEALAPPLHQFFGDLPVPLMSQKGKSHLGGQPCHFNMLQSVPAKSGETLSLQVWPPAHDKPHLWHFIGAVISGLGACVPHSCRGTDAIQVCPAGIGLPINKGMSIGTRSRDASQRHHGVLAR